MTKVNQLDFTDITIFCGLAVHKVSWRVNLRDSELELKDFTQPADASLWYKHLTKNYPVAKYKAAYEQVPNDVAAAANNVQPRYCKCSC